MKVLNDLIKLSCNDDHISKITIDKLIHAKKLLLINPRNNKELIQVLVAMNLINAALKRKEFINKDKDVLIHYRLLKPRVSRLFHTIINNKNTFNIEFYIDDDKNKCAYIEIDGLQFSFHNIVLDEQIKEFIKSDLNNPKPWKGVRLQKVAGELFDYILGTKESDNII